MGMFIWNIILIITIITIMLITIMMIIKTIIIIIAITTRISSNIIFSHLILFNFY